jgi:hypothetical protein
VAWLIARQLRADRTWSAFMPWAVVHLMLFISALWIMNQPMDMRGPFLGG